MNTWIGLIAAIAVVLAAWSTPGVAQSGSGASASGQSSSSMRRPSASKPHLVAIQVNANDPATMNLALNNAQNIVQHFKALSQPVKIEIVTYGPGLNMLRDDKSPVKQRISALALETPQVTFAACANTRDNMAKTEGVEIKIMPEAKIVPSGVVRLMELQGQGYAYIKL